MKKAARNNWCEGGLKILSNEGFQRVTIDSLCLLLNKTKGSFYHHFKNIDEYIEALMKFWLEKNTVEFINDTETIIGVDKKRNKLNELASSSEQKVEQVIRAWSFTNGLVRRYLQQVDDLRMDYLVGLNIERDMNEIEARDYAIIEYSTLIGIQQLCPDISQKDLKRLYQVFLNNVEHTQEI